MKLDNLLNDKPSNGHKYYVKRPVKSKTERKERAILCRAAKGVLYDKHKDIYAYGLSINKLLSLLENKGFKGHSDIDTLKNFLNGKHRRGDKYSGVVSFYDSDEWKALRYKAFAQYGNKCQACGRSPKDGIVLHVDHIKPRFKYPELALSIDNVQILCADCNLGKSNKYEIDHR
ncbi:MAG: HNH endonuclease [Desulfobulbaceae bacterium]|nr:HNH endonuclease [Desulfobulbaceae bacterium]